MHEALLETLYEHFQLGNQTDGGGFKADVWALALEAVRRVYTGDGVVEESSCRNKWTWFKEAWKNWKILARMTRALSVYSNRPAVPNIDPALADSQVSPTIQRSTYSRSQSDRNESDNEDEKRPRKKQKVDIGQAVASKVDELRRSREAKQDKKTVQETAIDLLYRDYETRLDTDAFVDAINVLESESKARIFTRLKADEKRDRWLEVAIGTELLPQHQDEKLSLDS
ncbi:hypothetical protein V1509DRAFT_676245 [Lipomyces kononenkoae]